VISHIATVALIGERPAVIMFAGAVASVWYAVLLYWIVRERRSYTSGDAGPSDGRRRETPFPGLNSETEAVGEAAATMKQAASHERMEAEQVLAEAKRSKGRADREWVEFRPKYARYLAETMLNEGRDDPDIVAATEAALSRPRPHFWMGYKLSPSGARSDDERAAWVVAQDAAHQAGSGPRS
jgi:hypothetical protein